jgi:GDP/UDP-N,N'-diacetylbacillosamine 2-epimerase (hydrolysing)
MKIGILTSSRADYGIYRPLLLKLKNDSFFEIEIIAFGMHVSELHGLTVSAIEEDGYKTIWKINSLLSSDSNSGIAASYGLTVLKFADFWQNNHYDLIFCLGDRFEMNAAVQSGIPFNITFAHIHGGETTLGAIDNIYRHQITLASKLHFVATDEYKAVIERLVENAKVYNVGALSLDELKSIKFEDRHTFLKKFGLPDKEYALVTFHPETIATLAENEEMAGAMYESLKTIAREMHIVATMPNADTNSSVYRNKLKLLKEEPDGNMTLIENFGKLNYFNAMKHSRIMIGNTSSGIIEAASFGKYVINVGDRQKGRAVSLNVINCIFRAEEIISAFQEAMLLGSYNGNNVYFKAGAADNIISVLKGNYAEP